jgi:hypothetical protein
VLHAGSLVLYTFTNGAVTSGDAEPWARPITPIAPDGPYGVLLRDRDRLVLATRATSANAPTVQACPYQLLSGRFQRTAGDCPQTSGELIGFEPSVLWTRDPPALGGSGFNSGLVHRLLWTGDQLVEQGSLSPGPSLSFIDRSLKRNAAVPVLRETVSSADAAPLSVVVSWSPERKVLLLEHLDAEVSEPYASPSLYWGRQLVTPAAQPLKVRLRSPPP